MMTDTMQLKKQNSGDKSTVCPRSLADFYIVTKYIPNGNMKKLDMGLG